MNYLEDGWQASKQSNSKLNHAMVKKKDHRHQHRCTLQTTLVAVVVGEMVGVTFTIREVVVATATEAEEVVAMVKDAKEVAVAAVAVVNTLQHGKVIVDTVVNPTTRHQNVGNKSLTSLKRQNNKT
jgi:hypothetical protein